MTMKMYYNAPQTDVSPLSAAQLLLVSGNPGVTTPDGNVSKEVISYTPGD